MNKNFEQSVQCQLSSEQQSSCSEGQNPENKIQKVKKGDSGAHSEKEP